MKKKVLSVLLVFVMLAGVLTGCSKTSGMNKDKFVKACEKLKLTELEIDEMDEIEENVEDGFYFAGDEDLIADKSKIIDTYLKIAKLSKVFDSDDIVSIAFAAKCAGYDDIKESEGPEDVELDGAFAFQMDFGQKDKAEDVMDGIAKLLKQVNIKTKKLTPKEYYVSKNEGYIRFHIDLEKFARIILDDDDLTDSLKDLYDVDIEDTMEDLKGDIAVSVEIKGSNIFIFAGGAVNSEKKVYKDFVKAFGLATDPMSLPMNEEVADDMTELIVSYAKYISKARDAKKRLTDPIGGTGGTGGTGSTGGIGGTGGAGGTGGNPDNKGIQGSGKVGISMPTKDLMRWLRDGEKMKEEFEALGYTVDIQFAGNNTATQVAQITNMINSGCDVLIVAAIESSSLYGVLEKAKSKNIPVIAYDRLIYGTEAVDYYVSFDNYMVGQLQGKYIVEALDLDNANGSFNIEITAGDPTDNNAALFYQGAMDAIKPYIDSGKLKVLSGQKDFKDVATDSWKTDNAQARAENILAAYYQSGTNIDAWLCSNDSTACGVINALDKYYKGNYPVITGQDCDILSVKHIIAGKQAMSVFKDTRTLASQAAKMASQVMNGQKVDVNDTDTYNNGKKDISSYLCSPVFVTVDNYKTILVDSGYYTQDALDY